jgi:hypothetical protein
VAIIHSKLCVECPRLSQCRGGEKFNGKRTAGDLHTYTGARQERDVPGLVRLLIALPELLERRAVGRAAQVGAFAGSGGGGSVMRRLRGDGHLLRVAWRQNNEQGLLLYFRWDPPLV